MVHSIVFYPVSIFVVTLGQMDVNGKIQCEDYAADISSIKEAQLRITSLIHRTPVLTSENLNSVSGRKLFFKCECFQKG